MANPKFVFVYLKRDVTFNNCKCCGWSNLDRGLVTFKAMTKVKMYKAKGKELKRCRELEDSTGEAHYIVDIMGKRKPLGRSALISENEAREQTNEQRHKLSLLKDRARSLDKGSN